MDFRLLGEYLCFCSVSCILGTLLICAPVHYGRDDNCKVLWVLTSYQLFVCTLINRSGNSKFYKYICTVIYTIRGCGTRATLSFGAKMHLTFPAKTGYPGSQFQSAERTGRSVYLL